MSTINGSSGLYQPVNNYQLNNLKAKTEQIGQGLQKKADKDAVLRQACEDFEAVFMQLVFKEMRKTVQKGELTDGGFGQEVFEGMMDEEISKTAAKQNGSIADLLYKQLRLQLDDQS